MEKVAAFTHKLDMALRLIDTTDGRSIPCRTVRVWINNTQVHCINRHDDIMVFQNIGAERFRLDVSASGFEPTGLDVLLTSLNKTLPLLELHMIPGSNYRSRFPLLTLSDTLNGIETLTAVKESENTVLAREFDPRRRLLTVFNPHHLALDRTHYALVDTDTRCYEPFRIVKNVDEKTVKLDHVLELPVKNYFPICPLVFGKVEDSGAYHLRVQDDTAAAQWLLRAEVDGTPRFRRIDFRQSRQPDWEVR